MGADLFKIFIVAIALALDVFAVAVGVGVRGIPRHRRIRIGIAFASAEITMNLIGAGLGIAAGRLIGDYAGYMGFGALVAVGIYMMRESFTQLGGSSRLDLSSGPGLLIASLAISLDSLGVGFSILYIGVPLEISLAVIFSVSVTSTTLGLALGRILGAIAERRAAFVGGLLLAITGVVFAVLKALHVG
jgi:manganese efflux pump family protein